MILLFIYYPKYDGETVDTCVMHLYMLSARRMKVKDVDDTAHLDALIELRMRIAHDDKVDD